MDIISVLFGFEGRIGRLAYFGYSVVAILTILALLTAAAPFLVGNPIGVCLGVAIVVLAGVLGAWTTLALMVKRLHDVGLSGLNVIWIYALSFLAGGDATHWLTMMSGALSLSVTLALLLWPGTRGYNPYG